MISLKFINIKVIIPFFILPLKASKDCKYIVQYTCACNNKKNFYEYLNSLHCKNTSSTKHRKFEFLT